MTRSTTARWNRRVCAVAGVAVAAPGRAGRIVLAVDVSPSLRSDAPPSSDRLFCHVYGRGEGQAQLIPGWPYSFIAAIEPGLDVVDRATRRDPPRSGRGRHRGDRRAAARRDRPPGRGRALARGRPHILIVAGANYDITRLAYVLADLPVELVGRLRSDRVLRLPAPRGRLARPVVHPSTAPKSPWTIPPPSPLPGTRRAPTPAATTPRSPPAGTGSIPGHWATCATRRTPKRIFETRSRPLASSG